MKARMERSGPPTLSLPLKGGGNAGATPLFSVDTGQATTMDLLAGVFAPSPLEGEGWGGGYLIGGLFLS